MDRTKCAQLLKEGREFGIETWEDLNKRWTDRGFVCEDCRGTNLGPVVKDEIWLEIVFHRNELGRVLCQKCMEFRLGKPILEKDCKREPWNVLRGNLKVEGKIMANRAMQAKRLKMKREKQNFPRYLSADKVKVDRYNGASPYAMKTRAFESPDAIIMDKDVRGILNGVVTDDKPREFNNISLAHVHNDLNRSKALSQVAFHTWYNWRLTKQTEFCFINKINRPGYRRIDLWFSGQQWLFIQENYETNEHSCSIVYTSKEHAEFYFNNGITWAETRPLNST